MSEMKELPPVHLDAESLAEKGCKTFHPEPVRNLLVHKPTHEAVKVPCQPMIPVRDKESLTPRASVRDRSEFGDLAFYRSRRNDDVEGSLTPRLNILGPLLCGNSHNILGLAEWTLRCRYFHVVCRPYFSVLPGSPM